eukprot:scaffold43498_cov24-Prasinocladus_malaysianus.AAC.1
MANYQGTAGLTFAKFGDEGNGMLEVLVIMLVEFPVFMALAWYLEQVLGQSLIWARAIGYERL